MSFLGLSGMFGGDNGADWKAQNAGQAAAPALQGQASPEQAQAALGQQQALVNQLNAANGIGNQSQVYNQLQQQAAGQGPNPAQAMLAQNTGNNVAAQQALMAGQRGAGSNVGLLARQAAQQGANTQQQAVGQGATLQAQQSLGALSAAGQLANQQAAAQQQGVGNLNQFGQSLMNSQNAGINAQNQAQLQAAGQQNQFNLGNTQQQNAANVNIAEANQQFQQNAVKGITNGIGSAGMMLAGAEGGKVSRMPKMADGGMPMMNPYVNRGADSSGSGIFDFSKGPGGILGGGSSQGSAPDASNLPQLGELSDLAPMLAGANGGRVAMADGGSPMASIAKLAPLLMMAAANGGAVSDKGPKSFAAKHLKSQPMKDITPPPVAMAKGGKVPALVSPGEIYLKPAQAQMVAKGKASPLIGERIPGKPVVPGKVNSYANDIIPKDLDKGGVVIPRSKSMSKDHDKMTSFVHAALSHKK